jgi:hypothetical protein
VQYKTTGPGGTKGWVNLAGATQTIIPDTQLALGETKAFEYEIFFSPIAGAEYKNLAKVTITNHDAASMGKDKGPTVNTDAFTMPASRTTVEIDRASSLSDEIDCPDGFTCEYGPTVTWPKTFTGSGIYEYAVTIANGNAACDSTFKLNNTANLTECDTEVVRTAEATVEIYTGTCPTGCTYTIGYWKNHAGFRPAG